MKKTRTVHLVFFQYSEETYFDLADRLKYCGKKNKTVYVLRVAQAQG